MPRSGIIIVIIIIIIIIIIIFVVVASFRVFYTHVPETHRVSTIRNFIAFLQLHFMVHVTLFAMINPLYFYISRVQYGRLLWFLYFVISRYVAQLFS